MTDDERLDLRALRARREVRDRVIEGAMARVRAAPRGWVRVAVEGSGRYVGPVLAAAAVILLFLLLPDRSPKPASPTTGALVAAATDDADPVLQWSLGDGAPDPREVLVRYAGTSP